nr:RluA family pseudouridine synthase [Aquibacillus sediminis]
MIEKQHQDMLVYDYLRQIKGFSSRLLKEVKYDRLLVNGKVVTVRRRLVAGDELEVLLPPEGRGASLQSEQLPLEIIYEDDDVLVVNKPAGIATLPSMNHKSGTIANRLLGYYDQHHLPYTVHIVTRLDADTSGLLLVAKHRYSHLLLFRDQQKGLINRRYQAIIEGQLSNKQGTIRLPIGRKSGSIIERTVVEDGKPAITHYQVLEIRNGYTNVGVNLETGRTHQIRVHFAHIGHPLLGDGLYGQKKQEIERHALHCSGLSFQHPITNELKTFHAEMPADMKQIIL